MDTIVWVDPPTGWAYGFPRIWDRNKEPSYEKFLRDNGYPEKDIELATCYSRFWRADRDENPSNS